MNDESWGTMIAATRPAIRPSLSLVSPKGLNRTQPSRSAEGPRSCASDLLSVVPPRSKSAMPSQQEDQQVSARVTSTPDDISTKADWTDAVSALQAGQRAVRTDLMALLRAQSVKGNSIRGLRECAHGYAEKADLLLLSLVRDKAPATVIEATETLFDDLRQAEEEIEGLWASVTLQAS
jgi:hypothetical protein